MARQITLKSICVFKMSRQTTLKCICVFEMVRQITSSLLPELSAARVANNGSYFPMYFLTSGIFLCVQVCVCVCVHLCITHACMCYKCVRSQAKYTLTLLFSLNFRVFCFPPFVLCFLVDSIFFFFSLSV